MKCSQYLDWLYEARTTNIDYYTYGVDKSNSVTGIFCQIIGFILLIVGIIMFAVGIANKADDNLVQLTTFGSLIIGSGYIVSFIGFLRYNDFQNKGKWAFIFLPPVLIVMCLIYLIKNIVYISRSKKSLNLANARISSVEKNLSVYRNTAKYKTIDDMFNSLDFDYSSL